MEILKFTRDGQDWELPDAFYRISIKLVIKNKDDKLLVVQDQTDGSWEVPGGGLDHGETIERTARREIQEELGVELTKFGAEPIAITVGVHPKGYATMMLYYHGELSSYNFTPEGKFATKFVDKGEFLSLQMLGDELPIKEHIDKIWNNL